jgi:hypothetical protein
VTMRDNRLREAALEDLHDPRPARVAAQAAHALAAHSRWGARREGADAQLVQRFARLADEFDDVAGVGEFHVAGAAETRR